MIRAALFLSCLAIVPLASGASVTITPVADTTIYQNTEEQLSNGAGGWLFVGRTNSFGLRRAMLRFDVANAVPAGSTITSARLVLRCDRAQGSNLPLTLQAMVGEWNEGTTNADGQEGGGGPAQAGDSTWNFRVYNGDGGGTSWTAGGTFETSNLSSVMSTGVGVITFPSTTNIVGAVQQWLDSPSSNTGFMLNSNPSSGGIARRIVSREGFVDNRPRLIIEFTAPPPCNIDFNNDGLFPDDQDLVDFLSVLAGGPCSTSACDGIDFNNDGLFPDDGDLAAFLGVLAGGSC